LSLSNQKLKELNEMDLNDPARPPVVETNNFKHSKHMAFPNAPPTDRQYKYLKNLGYNGELPKTRKEAGNIITKLTQPVMTQSLTVGIASEKIYNMEGDEIDKNGNVIRKGARFS